MAIGTIIGPDQVLVGVRVSDKTQLLRMLADRAALALNLDGQRIFDALLRRENLGSTGFSNGFALPHARLEAFYGRFALFARLVRPIEFAAVDGRPVDLVILLLTPADASSEHLTTLAALARPMRDEGLLRRLRGVPDAEALYRMLASA
jgi:PTS system nitrogen regulatory IIA component